MIIIGKSEKEDEYEIGAEFGEHVDRANVGAVAYAVGDNEGEPPEEYDGENKLVEIFLSIADAS